VQTSFAHLFQHRRPSAQLGVATQAVEGLVSPPTVAKPHQGFASSARLTCRAAAQGAAIPGPVPATVAARTLFGFVSEAPYELRLANRVGRNLPFLVYTRNGDQGRLLSLVLALRVWHHPGAFLSPYLIIGNLYVIYKKYIGNVRARTTCCFVKSSYEDALCL